MKGIFWLEAGTTMQGLASDFCRDVDLSASPNVSNASLIEAVTAQLEEDIVFGVLQPRERIVEEDQSERLGVKRHIVRSALMELERLELVERVRNRGTMVKMFAAREVEELHLTRELLECHAASLIPLPLPEEALDNLSALQELHAAAVRDGDLRGAFRSNLVFHEALFSLCSNKVLFQTIRGLAQKSHGYRSVLIKDKENLNWAAQAHFEMVEALRAQDRETLIRLCREHLEPCKKHYIRMWNMRFG
ncbi:GntR family transcriptional regulator [Nitratireductor aquibiodomus]|uniref:GntR family transcriptional regulator n=1 Tax=Nitratireductor aquibiodomus TaxID=204799 RepID=UPI001FEE0D1C|nr:GntR family transcriptional regulator [Nitratireductor aquibiodomus]